MMYHEALFRQVLFNCHNHSNSSFLNVLFSHTFVIICTSFMFTFRLCCALHRIAHMQSLSDNKQISD